MKKKIKTIITNLRQVPIQIFIILSVITNYLFGQAIARINELYSNVTEFESRNDFIVSLLYLILFWFICRMANQVIGKVEKHRLLNINYLKWITRLTNSKLSSISSLTTGAAQNAINTIAMTDKGMVDCMMGIIPNIIPFFILCKKEWEVAGLLPTVVNVGFMIVYIILGYFMSKFPAYAEQAKARADISTVTVDCIRNTQTVKCFNKEQWSINRQDTAQQETFAGQLALSAVVISTTIDILAWIPTAANVYLCWESKSTVLYIILMSYVIDNIIGYIMAGVELFTEKTNQVKILGNLEEDTVEKKELPDSLNLSGIEFKYDTEKENAVLFKIDKFAIEKGKRYCVTGTSGFGKSTFAKVLCGINKPTKGTIPELKSVYMFAESEMFNTSIAENIVLGETDYDIAEVKALLKAFDVNVDIDIISDTVGENGSKLSTGQKQRINLCRTLFYARRNPGALIIMDEVTAALDIKTSITCLEYLTEEFKRLGVTLIYISNKSDYLQTDLITNNIYVHKCNNVVTYDSVEE